MREECTRTSASQSSTSRPPRRSRFARFPGKSVYHTNKALQEGFTNALQEGFANALRVELTGTNICVLALRPSVVDAHLHRQRVGYDEEINEKFMQRYGSLVSEDLVAAVEYMLRGL
jgi:NADP-dependent 3-hydroxy acid dehydrogenase YdfG